MELLTHGGSSCNITENFTYWPTVFFFGEVKAESSGVYFLPKITFVTVLIVVPKNRHNTFEMSDAVMLTVSSYPCPAAPG